MGLALLLANVNLCCEVKPNLRREVLETNRAGSRSDLGLRGTRNSFSKNNVNTRFDVLLDSGQDLVQVARPAKDTKGNN